MTFDKKDIDETFTFPKLSLGKTDIGVEIMSAARHIREVVSSATQTRFCHLSFYPVAKNIRFVSTSFYKSIREGMRPYLSDTCRPGEEHFWAGMTGQSWYPWLWTRYANPSVIEGNRASWGRIFMSIEDEVNAPSYAEISFGPFFLYLACLAHVFRIRPEFLQHLSQNYMAEFPSEPVCGLQIRRGEIVPRSGSVDDAWKIRRLYTIDEYMDGAKKVCDAIGTKHIFLSSDSSETIDYLRERYQSYSFIVNKYDRNLFLRFQGDPDKVSLERDLQIKPSLTRHYTESCLIDLFMLARCKGYVGGMKYSEYGACGWFLQMAEQKSITPYYNIEGEFCLTGNPVQMLLH